MIKKLSSTLKDKKARDKLRKKTLPKAILIFFAIVLVFYFVKNTLTPTPTKEELVENKSMLTVKVQTVHKNQTQGAIVVNGQTVAGISVPLKARTAGKVEKILKQKGEFVKKDEVIMTLSQDDRSARLSAVKAKIKDAEFRYKTTKEMVDQDFESPLTLAREKASLESVQAELKAIQQDIDYTSIKAPFDGIFDTRNVEVGDVINPQMDLGMFVSLNPMLIQSNLSEKFFGQINQSTYVKAEFSNASYMIGKVVYISNLLDTKTRTFLTETQIENNDSNIGIGQTVKLTFLLDQKHGFYLKNQSLLTLDENGTMGVKVVENGTVNFMPVEIIKNEENAIWVTGLYEGAKVITLGQEFVDIGDKVNIQEEQVEIPNNNNQQQKENTNE